MHAGSEPEPFAVAGDIIALTVEGPANSPSLRIEKNGVLMGSQPLPHLQKRELKVSLTTNLLSR